MPKSSTRGEFLPSFSREMMDSNGVPVKGRTFGPDDFTTLPLEVSGYDQIGIVVDASGASGNCRATAQMSFDGGTTWLTVWPGADNAETQAIINTFSSATETAKFWPVRVTPGQALFRLNWEVGTSVAFTNAWVVARQQSMFAGG